MKSEVPVVLREVRPPDLLRLRELVALGWRDQGAAHLLEKRYGELGGKPWLEWKWPEIASVCQDRPHHVIVSEVAGKVVGFASYSLDTVRRVGTVGNNTVDPAYRGLGIGGKLHACVLARIRAAGMLYAEVTVALNEGHAAARAVYEKAGFVKVVDSRYMFMELQPE